MREGFTLEGRKGDWRDKDASVRECIPRTKLGPDVGRGVKVRGKGKKSREEMRQFSAKVKSQDENHFCLKNQLRKERM